MPRPINLPEYNKKRGEILDAAMRLILTRGYEQTAIQDIIDTLAISKGAFYHYFDSKPDLLQGLVERMVEEVQQVLPPIVADPSLPALTKLERLFATTSTMKDTRRGFLMNILRGWYADQNAVLRQKFTLAAGQMMAGYLAEIFSQGRREGVFDALLPEQAAQVAVGMMLHLGDTLSTMLLALAPDSGADERQATLQRMIDLLVTYRAALERVLGAPAGSLTLFDAGLLAGWVEPAPTAISPASARH